MWSLLLVEAILVAILNFMPYTVSSMGILGDFIFFHLEDLKESILKKSAFSIFFPGLAKIEPNAPGLYG